MWCEAKGIDCHYCGVYGECRGSCGLPDAEPSTLGTSSSYLVNTSSEKSIDDIKREAVKEFTEKLKAKAYTNNYCQEVILKNDIDKLLKEYEK